MNKLIPINIEATDIPDAWFQCVNAIFDNGFKYIIEHGSYIGQTRLEYDWITIYIKHPYNEPYDLMLPQIPTHYNIPNPVENGYVEQYLPYLMTGNKQDKEDYTYGQRINAFEEIKYMYVKSEPLNGLYGKERNLYTINKNIYSQVNHWIKVLKETTNTNQAVLQVAQPSDCLLNDPPCLRHIDMRVKDNTLIFYPYFRSWDLWNGFPANLAGIAVLQKYMADEIGVDNGPIIASSKGLHLYKYVEELAKKRIGRE